MYHIYYFDQINRIFIYTHARGGPLYRVETGQVPKLTTIGQFFYEYI